ncbi:peptide ABC transporter permease [Spirochaetia bacterium]|nr:peptide ABC transporter permease [Spirochaetia bacterium]
MTSDILSGEDFTDRPVKKKSQFWAVVKQLFKNKTAVVGFVIVVILVLLAILAPWIQPYEYTAINAEEAWQGPSLRHLCGTDQLGRDMLSRLLIGSRYSLQIGIWATLFGTLAGVIIGSIAGFFGGAVDEVIMRVTDVIQSIPGMILNVAISAALGPGFVNCIIALAAGGVAGSARMMRASILGIRQMEYINAAGLINCRDAKIIVKHLIPNAFAPMIVAATMGIGGTIMQASGLSYLGLGVQAPTPEWGAMLSEGRNYLRRYPFMSIFPGLLIMITVLAFNLFGDGLRDALDPKQKK